MSAPAKVDTVDANWIGRTFASDPDLKLPARPRLIPEILIAPIDPDGLLFYGTAEIQVIRGKSARTHLAAMLPLLDGTRTLPELAAAYGRLSVEQVQALVSLLHSRGLLEDGAAPEPERPEHREVQAWLGRFVDVTRRNSHRGEAWQGLTRARVSIIGDGARALEVRRLLQACGIERVSLTNIVPPDDSVAFIVADDDSWVDTAGLAERFASGRPRPLVVMTPRTTIIGSTLARGMSACPRCIAKAVRALPSGAPFAAPAAMSGLAAQQLVVSLSRVGSIEPVTSYLAFVGDGASFSRHQLAAAPEPGCATCGGNTRTLDERSRRAWVFHCMTSFPSREQLPPKAHQNHYRVSNMKLAREHEQTALARGPQLTRTLPERSAEVTLETLSALLLRGGGLHGDKEQARRIVPTGGDLGSPQLFVAAARVSGLARGLYRYDAERHALDIVAVGEWSLGVAGEHEPACLILGMGDAAKVMRKYHGFGLRVVHLDAGVTLGFLTLVARALGLPAWETRRFDPRQVLEGMRLPVDRGLLPTFVLGVGGAMVPSAASLMPPSPPPLEPVASLDELLGSMQPMLLEPRHNGIAPWQTIAQSRTGALDVPSLAALDAILLRRRAIRQYTRVGLRGADVESVVAAGMEAVAARAGDGMESPLLARVYVARALPGLSAGVYGSTPAAPSLAPIASSSNEDRIRSLVIQDTLGAAPVGVMLAVDLERALREGGVAGYADALTDAGMAVSRMWLTAVALELVGCPAGGVIADRARLGDRVLLDEAPLVGFFFGKGAAQ